MTPLLFVTISILLFCFNHLYILTENNNIFYLIHVIMFHRLFILLLTFYNIFNANILHHSNYNSKQKFINEFNNIRIIIII